MKILDIPQSGKRGVIVAFQSPFGLCHRQFVVPANPQTQARQRMRGSFGRLSSAWGKLLTQAQRNAWDAAGPKVQSHKRLGQSGPLSGQQHFQSINSARACIGLEPLWDPPAPVVFDPSPIGPLVITNGDDGVRLMLEISGTITTDIMVFGQAPCSAGRNKRRNVAYLGLLPAIQGKMCEITALYVARYGEPKPGEKVFIVTCQQKDGWEGFELQTSEIVPEKPAEQQAIASTTLTLQVPMHKGCTTDVQRTGATVGLVPP